jgi:replicative DNA helicase
VREVPHNVEVEAAVLGAMMLTRHALDRSLAMLVAADFYMPLHQDVFASCAALRSRNLPVDPVLVAAEIGAGAGPLMAMAAGTPAGVDPSSYCGEVRRLSVARRTMTAGYEIAEMGLAAERPELANEKLERMLLALLSENHGDSLGRGGVALGTEMLDYLEAEAEGVLPTGFADIDRVLNGGMRPGQLIVIGARTGQGKTAAAVTIAWSVAMRRKVPTLIFSLEMGSLEVTKRLVSIDSNVPLSDILRKRLDPKQLRQVHTSTGLLMDSPLTIVDRGQMTMSRVAAEARRAHVECGGLGLVVVDYLQLMQGSDAEQREQQLSGFTRGLKLLARELGCPVIAAAQVNREGANRPDQRPQLTDLRGSGAIEQDADVVILLSRNEEDTASGVCRWDVAKNRAGEARHVEMVWLGAFTRFAEQWRGPAPEERF